MENEEKHRIADCRIAVKGALEFIGCITTELKQSGFEYIHIISPCDGESMPSNVDVIVENVNEGSSCLSEDTTKPLILLFDFVNGAGAIVVLSGDDLELLSKPKLREWVANYMVGYCEFWNRDGCDWLRDSLPDVEKGFTSVAATKTASHLSARLAANIAVGREVKHFPRFYLCRNL